MLSITASLFETKIPKFMYRSGPVQNITPKDILKITSTIKYDNHTDDEYKIKSIDQILKTREGICYDIVELERELFTKLHYEFKTFFAYQGLPIDEHPTHTFLVFKENNKYYWFESSWESYRAIHNPFNSYKEVCNYVVKQLKQSSNWKSVKIIEYTSFNYKNMNPNDFAEYIVTNYDNN